MSEGQFGPWIGTPMSERDVDDLLTDAGYGILSLARESEAYALPVSVGYDGEDVYLGFLEMDSPHRKSEFAAETERACLNVSDIGGRFDWENVIVSGPLHPVEDGSDEFTHLMETLEDNGWFSSTFARDSSIDHIQGYVLEAEEVSGRQKREES